MSLLLAAVPLVLVMAVLVTVVFVMLFFFFIMPVFMVFARSFPFNVNPAISFDIVGTACIDLNVYPWRWRQEAVNMDIHIGRAGKGGWRGESGPGLIEAEGYDGC